METDAVRLADAIVVLADTLVVRFDIVDLLHELTNRCADLVAADAAALVLADPDGVLRVMASSSAEARLMELFQLQQNEGPCLDAYRSGRQIEGRNLQGGVADRWPSFTAEALRVGFSSVHALPLRLHGEVLGAMGLFCQRTEGLSADHVRLAQALADLATISLVQLRRARQREELTAQLQHALDSRVVIERATGVVAGRTGRSMDESFSLLRAAARRQRRRLSDVAHDVVHGRLDVDTLR